MNNGIIIVATNKISYYDKACYLAGTIKDFAPDFHITLFTEKIFLDSKSKIFDNIIIDIPNKNFRVDRRTKMWCMANSPYDTTLYLDADMEVVHEDFCNVFDQIKDSDLLWTKITEDREYAFAFVKAGSVNLLYHGGICLYKSSAKKFMMDWYKLWVKQANFEWWPEKSDSYSDYPIYLRDFDQFTLWWLLNKEGDKYKYLKHNFFEDDTRWNASPLYRKSLGHAKNPIIIHNYTGLGNKK